MARAHLQDVVHPQEQLAGVEGAARQDRRERARLLGLIARDRQLGDESRQLRVDEPQGVLARAPERGQRLRVEMRLDARPVLQVVAGEQPQQPQRRLRIRGTALRRLAIIGSARPAHPDGVAVCDCGVDGASCVGCVLIGTPGLVWAAVFAS